ncbi:MAG: hypothetical protein ACOY5F_10165 [Pseudomonadota bacterium]|jgi:hypothetical protein
MPSYGLNSTDDLCPIPESLFGQLYRSHPNGLPELVATIPARTRALLALFCYRRAHLHALSLAIASTCEESDLIDAGGRAGAALYELSRQSGAPVAIQENGRRKISLAQGPLWHPAPLEDDYED